MKNIKVKPLFGDNFRKDINFGRNLLLLQIILIFLYGTLECYRYLMVDSHLAAMVFIPLMLVALSIMFFLGYLHKATIPFTNPLYSIMLLLFIIDSTMVIRHIMVTGNNNRSLREMILLIISLGVAIILLLTYKKMITLYGSLLPSYKKYTNIINIRVRKNKVKRIFLKKLNKFENK